MAFCLTKSEVEKFKAGFISGELNPQKLANMTSEERQAFFTEFSNAENAVQINSLFESKLLLKNQKQGMVTWAKKLTGITKPVRRDIFARIERLDTVLSPDQEADFLNDLARTRLGVNITFEEAKFINQASKEMVEAKDKWSKKLESKPEWSENSMKTYNEWANDPDRLDFGRKKAALGMYLADLNNKSKKKTVKQKLKDPGELAVDIAGNAKAIRASIDNSALLRQGWRTLLVSPKIWKKNAANSFLNIAKTIGGREVMMEVNADLLSRPNALNGKYKDMQLALGVVEEEFPGTVAEKLPGIGRAFKASDVAFTAFSQQNRADLADKYIEIAEQSGVKLDKDQLKDIGKMVNALTGRGSIGKSDAQLKTINNIFWSPRFVKSHLDVVTTPFNPKTSSFVRKESSKNLAKIVAGNAAIMALAAAVFGEDAIEMDATSSDFGKIRVGNTRFDISGGAASLFVLATRVIKGERKSATTGKVTVLNTGEYGEVTVKDLFYDFAENKTSPVASVILDYMEGETFDGDKPTLGHAAQSLFIPLPLENAYEAYKEPTSANLAAIIIADSVGIGTNTFAPSSNWSRKTSKEMNSFREQVGEKKFFEANEEYNKRYSEFVNSIAKKSEYVNLSDKGKDTLLTRQREVIKKEVLEEFGFEGTKKQTKEEKAEKKTIEKLLE